MSLNSRFRVGSFVAIRKLSSARSKIRFLLKQKTTVKLTFLKMNKLIQRFNLVSLPSGINYLTPVVNGLIQRKIHQTTSIFKFSEEELKKHQEEIMSRGLPEKKPIPGVKNVVLVASGKGGVGKSTTAVNLSLALKYIAPSKKVGILDTDVYGPSIPLMMNLRDPPRLTKDNQMEPLQNYGVKCMSMGFLVDEKSPVMMRGLMVMSMIDKLLRQVCWGELDYLIVDTPPGTGDTHISLIQNVPIAGVVLVTTPHEAALQVCGRGALMFTKLKVPIIGIVQNMSRVICSKCSADLKIFGSGTEQLAFQLGLDMLEDIPLDESISEGCNTGKPVLLLSPESKQSQSYMNLAAKVYKFLEERNN